MKNPTKETVWRITPFLNPIIPPMSNNKIIMTSMIFTLPPLFHYITKMEKIKVCFQRKV